MMKNRLPIKREGSLPHHGANVFCGSFSKDGDVYMSASQDGRVRLFEYPSMTARREIYAQDIGWSIIDTDYSPDQRFLIYSSWSPYGFFSFFSFFFEQNHITNNNNN
jgi:WD repeat-containing protein 23